MYNKLLEFLREIDTFGVPVTFKINNEDEFKSAAGGVATIVVNIISLIYAIYSLVLYFTDSYIPSIQDQTLKSQSTLLHQFDYNFISMTVAQIDGQIISNNFDYLNRDEAIFIMSKYQIKNLKVDSDPIYLNSFDDCQRRKYAFCVVDKNFPHQTYISKADNEIKALLLNMTLCNYDNKAVREQNITCANNSFLDQLKDNIYILMVELQIQQYDINSRSIIHIPKMYYFFLKYGQSVNLQMYVKLSEITVTDGMFFPSTYRFNIIGDIEISTGELNGSNDTLFLGYVQLSEQRTQKFIRYISLIQVLANIGSVMTVLYLAQHFMIRVNQKLLFKFLSIEILKLYYPQLNEREIKVNTFGDLVYIEGLSQTAFDKLISQNQIYINEQFSILTLFKQVSLLQKAIKNIYPVSLLHILKHTGDELPTEILINYKTFEYDYENSQQNEEEFNTLKIFNEDVDFPSLMLHQILDDEIPVVLKKQQFLEQIITKR